MRMESNYLQDEFEEISEILNSNYITFNNLSFIKNDPISIPHKFKRKEDIEISGFLTAIISWGQRKAIINSANKLMHLMGNNPFEFISNYKQTDYKFLENFVYRTFNHIDLIFFIESLQNIYNNHGGLEKVFKDGFVKNSNNSYEAINYFRNIFIETEHLQRSVKHLANPAKGSAAKKINMFLRWMVRKDNKGVDFGLWKKISPAWLACPLDVHSGATARKIKLLNRKQNDWKSVVELTDNLRLFDKNDPVKYDFALFSIGVNAVELY